MKADAGVVQGLITTMEVGESNRRRRKEDPFFSFVALSLGRLTTSFHSKLSRKKRLRVPVCVDKKVRILNPDIDPLWLNFDGSSYNDRHCPAILIDL